MFWDAKMRYIGCKERIIKNIEELVKYCTFKWTTVNGNRPVLSGEFAEVELKAPFIRRVSIDGKDEIGRAHV